MTWRIVHPDGGLAMGGAIVDETGRSLLALHNATPVFADPQVAERVAEMLNASAGSRAEADDRAAIVRFVQTVSAAYRKHTAEAVREDMIIACIVYGIDPNDFYSNAEEARPLRADVAYHRELGTYDGHLS